MVRLIADFEFHFYVGRPQPHSEGVRGAAEEGRFEGRPYQWTADSTRRLLLEQRLGEGGDQAEGDIAAEARQKSDLLFG